MIKLREGVVVGIQPEVWDGFTFYVDRLLGCVVKFTFFDDMVREFGPPERDPKLPLDRESYHVLLSSVRKAVIHIEEPFTSNFLDPFEYARHVAHAGFSGVMIRKTQYSLDLLRTTLEQMMKLHAAGPGFIYNNKFIKVSDE